MPGWNREGVSRRPGREPLLAADRLSQLSLLTEGAALTPTEKLKLHDAHSRAALERLVRWLQTEPEVILAAARGRHAWGSVRYGDRLMYEYDDPELRANALEELADAVNYLTVVEQREAAA